MSLHGKYVWVVGGAGMIGKGICRGLLGAGATVLVNSRHRNRLAALAEDIETDQDRERLITLKGSLLPGDSERLTQEVMDMTSGRLDHVVAHSGVQWWEDGGGDESSTLLRASRILDMSADEFSTAAVQLPLLHFEAARLLLPRLRALPSEPSSYTFITGGAHGVRGLAQINAQALWGLSAALQKEVSDVTMAEVRVELAINRSEVERCAAPRSSPLSHELGTLAAGIAASPVGVAAGLHNITSATDMSALLGRFPAAVKPC